MALQLIDPGGEPLQRLGTGTGIASDDNLAGITSFSPTGRLTTFAYGSSQSQAYIGWFIGNFQETIFGFAHYISSTTFNLNKRFVSCEDGTTNQVELVTDATGHLIPRRNGTVIGSASANALSTGWHYYEFRTKIAGGSLGSVEFRVDGVAWLTLTGVNTQASANAFANRFYVDALGSQPLNWKDIYILDRGTGVNTDYLGDVKIATLYPVTADGTFQQWAANTGTQVAAVQDFISHPSTGTWPDGDTTYIFDTVSGNISAFGLQTASLTAIKGVGHLTYARTASSGTINQVLVQSGAVVETSPTRTLTTSYKYYLDIVEQNPTGSVAWTSSAINSTHVGTKIQATSASARVSQEVLLVIALTSGGAGGGSRPQVWIIT